MKKLIQKISRALQVILLAPVKLPGRALNVIKFIALGLGVVETVLDVDERKEVQADDRVHQDAFETGIDGLAEKEVLDET